jgi:hypothetical protein
VVLDLLQRVRTVSTTDVDLQSGQGNPWVAVTKEGWEHIKDGVLGVNNLLQDAEIGLSVVPTSLAVSGLDNRGAEDVLHLGSTLLERWKRALDKHLSGLESNLGCLSCLEISQAAQSWAEVLGNVARAWLVWLVLVENGKDEVILCTDAAVGEDGTNDLHGVLLVLISESEDDLLVTRGSTREQALDGSVLLQEARHHVELVNLLALEVTVNDLGERCKSGLQEIDIASSNVLIEELLKRLREVLGWELALARSGTLHNLGELCIQLLRHSCVKSRELGVELAVWEFRITQDLDEFLEGGSHDDLVVETIEDVLEDGVEQDEALCWLGTNNLWWTEIWKLTKEGLGVLDAGWVIQSQDTKNVTCLESSSWLLDQLNDTIFLSEERHVHLHDLNFGKWLTGLDVLTILDGELDKLSGRRGSELGWVVFLLEETSLAVDAQTSGTDLFLPVHVVTATAEEDEKTSVAESADTHRTLRTVDEQVVAVQTGSGCGELVSVALVDEINREDRLENILGRDLTLLEAGTVLGDATLASNVGSANGTADDGKHGVWTLSGELLGNQLIQPTRRDGVVLEIWSLQKLDEVLNRGSKVTTDAQLLQSHDHVLSRCRTILAVGEDVTELGVGEAVDTTLCTHREVTPHVGAGSEVQLVHSTTGWLETLTGVLGGDTASGGVALRGWSSLGLGAVLVGESEIDLGRGGWVGTVEQTDVANSVEGKTHGDLKLRSGQVDAGHHLGGWMFDLQSGVQLQEVELVLSVRVQVLNGTSRHVTHKTSQTHSGLFHLVEGQWLGNGDGRLLDNLLMSTLNRTISAKQGNVVSVLIGEQLHLQMSSVACKLHDENWRAGDLTGGGLVEGLKAFLLLGLSDTLATTTLGGLDHDGETDLLGLLETLLPRLHASLHVHFVRDRDETTLVNANRVDAGSGPRNTWDVGVLCDNGGGNLVTQGSHGGARRADEDNLFR